MAKATGMSASTVSRIWRAFGLKPHRMETYKLSTDPLSLKRYVTLSDSTCSRRNAR
ncbi:MAG: hypothetical protein OXH34_05770 [Bacteroidetes bacterium]|nr:hypothetical protein [Bacteroidota bacterium]